MNAWGDVLALDDRVRIRESCLGFLRVAVLRLLLKIVFFCDNFRRVGSNREVRMDHVRQHFICDFDRAQCVARDLGRCRGDSRNGSARKRTSVSGAGMIAFTGIFVAASVSSFVTRACACGLRSTRA